MTKYIVTGLDTGGRYYLSSHSFGPYWSVYLTHAERFHSIESAKQLLTKALALNRASGRIVTLDEAELLDIMEQ